MIPFLLAAYGLLLILALVPAALALRFTVNGQVALLVFNGREPAIDDPEAVVGGVRGPGSILIGYRPFIFWRGYSYYPIKHSYGSVSLPAKDGNVRLNLLSCRYGLDYRPEQHDAKAINVVKAYGSVGEGEDHDPGNLLLEKAMEMLEMATRHYTVLELTKGDKFPEAKKSAERAAADYAKDTLGFCFYEFIIGDTDTPQWVEDATAVEAMAEAHLTAKRREIDGDVEEVERLAKIYRDVPPELGREMDRDTVEKTFKGVHTLLVAPGDLVGQLFGGGKK